MVASGDKVIDDLGDPYVVAIREKWPNLIAVEMEAAEAAAAFAVQLIRSRWPLGPRS